MVLDLLLLRRRRPSRLSVYQPLFFPHCGSCAWKLSAVPSSNFAWGIGSGLSPVATKTHTANAFLYFINASFENYIDTSCGLSLSLSLSLSLALPACLPVRFDTAPNEGVDERTNGEFPTLWKMLRKRERENTAWIHNAVKLGKNRFCKVV